MVMDQRKAILTQCAEAVEHRMKKDPMQREPSPAIRTFLDSVLFFVLCRCERCASIRLCL